MKKTINIHLGGRLFNIEEAAYTRLSNYLNTIRGYFKNRESAEEILADIELRIAELFEERLYAGKEVITEKDIDEIIAIMGKPEDYVDGDDEFESTESSRTRPNTKQVFRDPDNKIIAGVCGGLGAYFGIDPIILRALFIIVTIFYGSGIIVYLVLAIIIPKAKTTAQKLKMHGEPVTVESISRKVSESFHTVKEDVKEFSDKNNINTEGFKKAGKKIEKSTSTFFNELAKVLRVFLMVLLKLVGVIIAFTGMLVIITSLGLGLGWESFTVIDYSGLGSIEDMEVLISIFEHVHHKIIFSLGLMLTLMVPGIFLLLLGIFILFDFQKIPVWLNVLLLVIWFTGICLLGVSFKGYLNQNTISEVSITDKPIALPLQADTLFIDLMADKDQGYEVSGGLKNGRFYMKLKNTNPSNDTTYFGLINLHVVQNNTDSIASLTIWRQANAHSEETAQNHIQKIITLHKLVEDTLFIKPFIGVLGSYNFINHKAEYTLKIPVGTAVHFKEGTEKILKKTETVNRPHDGKKENKTWVMTQNGLVCMGC